MKLCPHCQTQLADDAMFCTTCGAKFEAAPAYEAPQYDQQQQYQQQYQQQQYYNYAPVADPYDHTSEFDPQDISGNKVISMLVYLMGWIGIVIALLAANTSPYASFHVRQALKFSVVEILGALAAIILCWTFIVPIAYGIFVLVLNVVKIICFFQICNGKAKEPAIIRSLGFLR